MSQHEVKFITGKVELKADASGEKRIIRGYGSTFETGSRFDSYGDLVDPNAFDKVIAAVKDGSKSIKMLSQHSRNVPIGLWTIVEKDSRGLIVEGRVSKVAAGDEMITLIEDGVIDSLSIGFYLRQGGYHYLDETDDDGWPIRMLTEIDLIEVSPVTWPANEYARIDGLKSKRRDGQRPAAAKATRDQANQRAAMAIQLMCHNAGQL